MLPYVEPSESSTPHPIKNKSQKFSEGKQAQVWMEASKSNPKQVGMTPQQFHTIPKSCPPGVQAIMLLNLLEEAMM